MLPIENALMAESHHPAAIETRLFINNEFVEARGGKPFPVTNPATTDVVAWVHEAEEDDVENAVEAASQAFPSWPAKGAFERAAYLYRLADLFERHNERLAWLEAQSMGRPVGTYTEGLACARYLRYTAGKATDIQGESSLATAGFMNVTLRQPYGVCAGITPWNAPVTMMTFKFAPAIIAGNTIIMKSSEKAPLTHLYLPKLAKEAGLPPGVLNVVSGFGKTGALLASHMRIRKLSFTGSIRTGVAIKKAAASSNLKNVSLELGGKSPLIVFDDANIDRAAKAAAASILLNSGQACIASSRVYVHERVADTFCENLVTNIEQMGRNPPENNSPLSKTTKRGPQADRSQFESIMAFITEAKASGYRILTGGYQEGDKEYFIAPTVVFQPEEKSRIMKEEIFGPVQCVGTFRDEEEVLARANDTEFGLYASVFTQDIFRALRLAKRFESGNVGVNVSSPFMTHDMPFGGVKQSGEGRELGIYSVKEWTETKTVYFAMS